MAFEGRGNIVSRVKRPPVYSGSYKMNVDGALGMQGIYGMGAVIRNHSGDVMAAMSCRGQGRLAVEARHVLLIRMALEWASNMAFGRLVVECDNVCVVSSIHGDNKGSTSEFGNVLMDCRELMTKFEACSLQRAHGKGNSLALDLARRALILEDVEYWIEESHSN